MIVKSEEEKFYGMLFWETDYEPINGVLKENYQDFIVEEILPDGTVLSIENPHLTPSGYEGLFTHFILVKEGIGNYEAIWILAKKLKVPIGWFSYYGNKDRDALTIQCVSVWNVEPEKLLSLKLPPNLRIYSPIRELRGIKIGDHKGNNFIITIRKISNFSHAEKYFENLDEGLLLPNFFGYQRFGVTKPVSHITGKMLLKKKYWDAILTYLTFPSIYDDEKLREAKELIEENEFEKAISLLPKKGFLFEKKLLRELIKSRDIKRVIRRLPKFLVNMFLEAYQSYLFNLTLSEYRRRGGEYVENDKIVKLPLIGYNTPTVRLPEVNDIIGEIISEEGIKYTYFKNREIPSLNVKGSLRASALRFSPRKTEIIPNDKIIKIEFALEKGQYATIILREMFKENILFALYSKMVNKMGHEIFKSKIKEIVLLGTKMLRET